MTLATQVEKLKQRFHLDHVVLVGDRGMITQARITEDIKSAGLDWITALRAPAIKQLLNSGALQLSLFDQRDMASITSPDFPGERLVVCRNPDLAAERTRKREDLLTATEKDLARIQAAVARKRNPLRGTAAIALAVGAVVDTHKMRKHFDLDITDTAFSFARKTGEIAAEAATDGIYVVRTSLPAETLDDAATVRSYKSLALVERAFRCIKTVDLHVRPVYHWLADRVRAHVLLCMLAYYLEWHMRQRLAPMLFDDTDKQAAEALRASVVAKAQRSPAAVTKQTTGLTEDGLPVHSFRSLLADLATLARNTIITAISPRYPLTVMTRPRSNFDTYLRNLLSNQPLMGRQKIVGTTQGGFGQFSPVYGSDAWPGAGGGGWAVIRIIGGSARPTAWNTAPEQPGAAARRRSLLPP